MTGIFFASLLLLVASAQAQVLRGPIYQTPEKLLIRNVTILNQDGGDNNIVSMLLIDGKLDVITEDDIALDSADLALDADEGVILGNLDIGEPANFLILSGNPRDNPELLLDTARYGRFAVRDGEVLRNTLSEAKDDVRQPKRSGWLAYTPPPIAAPGSFQDTTKFNRWDTKWVSGLFLGALVLDRQNWQSQDAQSEAQVGNLDNFDGGEIRGLRFGAVGTINFTQPWVYTVFAASHAFDKGFDIDRDDGIEFFDYRLDIPLFKTNTLSIGKQKEPISMERLMGLIYLPLQERSAVSDALLPARNVGIVLSGTALNQNIAWAGGIFNDWIDTDESMSESSSQLIGRITGVPWAAPDDSNLFHLGFGLRLSNAKEGVAALTEPEFNQSPLFVDTGFFDADDATTYNLEGYWRRGPIWIGGEYTTADVDAPQFGNPNYDGYYVTASWALTGEMRGYNRRTGTFQPLPVARSVYQNGWGAVEVAARWSVFNTNDGLAGPTGVQGGDVDILSLGANWWLSPFFNVNFNYRWIELDRFGITGDSNGFNARIVLMLE
ncbi:MAG: OprO/OprP family phosphate-selective porin [Gammaproteobacteria bacterium]